MSSRVGRRWPLVTALATGPVTGGAALRRAPARRRRRPLRRPALRARPPPKAARPLPRRRSTAAGRGPTPRRAAGGSSSTRRRWPSWDDQRHMVAYAAVAYEAKGATKPALGSLKVEADTKVAVSERLVNFSVLQVTESNFPTLKKEEVREVVAEIVKAIPDHERVIALDRVLASRRQEPDPPEERGGREGGPAEDLLQPDARRPREPRRRADLEPDPRERPEVRRQHELGPLPARADEDVLPAEREDVAEGDRSRGPLGPGGDAARELRQAAGRRQLEGREGRPARPEAGRGQGAHGVREHDAGGADPGERPAALQAGRGHDAHLGQQHRERRVPGGRDGARLLPRLRPLVQRARLRGPLDVRHAQPARGLPEDPARAPALARARVGARHAAGGRGRAARAGAADGARQQEGAEGARGGLPGRAEVRADREDHRLARGEHGQGHHQGRRPLLHVLPGRVVHGQGADGAVGGHLLGPEADLRDPDELAREQRDLRDGRGGRLGRRVGDVRGGGGLHGRHDRVGLRRLGQRLVSPAVLGLGRGISLLLPALPELRLRRVVQPVDRLLRPPRGRVRSLRRRGRQLPLQPPHRHLLARRRGLGALRGARLRRGVQPAHRRLRPDAPGLERLRQLGQHRPCSAATSGRPRRG